MNIYKFEIAKGADCVCLMHMQGEPQTMQENPSYTDVVNDVKEFLDQQLQACMDAGIAKEKLIVDPGIGFGKSLEHNLSLLGRLSEFHDLDVPVLLGTSRKSFIAKIDEGAEPDKRIGGSIASVIAGLDKGAQIFRVHDVRETRQAIKVYQAIRSKAMDKQN